MNGENERKATRDPLHLRLLYPLHRSLFASVFVARDERKGNLVAIKRYAPMPAVERPDAVERFPEADLKKSREKFLFELDTISQFSHENLVRCLYADREADVPFFMMPLHPVSLWNEIWVQTPLRPRPRSLMAPRVVSVLQECLAGLASLHDRGIVHRDINPTNLFLGQGGVLRLGDFSMAQGNDGEGFTPLTSLGAQRAYMSPELFAKRFELVDERTDVYSVGVMAYRMITGRLPETEYGKPVTPPRDIDIEMDKALSDWVMAALERQPQDRPKDARELLENLPEL